MEKKTKYTTCPLCRGSGEYMNKTCRKCSGDGKILDEEVTINHGHGLFSMPEKLVSQSRIFKFKIGDKVENRDRIYPSSGTIIAFGADTEYGTRCHYVGDNDERYSSPEYYLHLLQDKNESGY